MEVVDSFSIIIPDSSARKRESSGLMWVYYQWLSGYPFPHTAVWDKLVMPADSRALSQEWREWVGMTRTKVL